MTINHSSFYRLFKPIESSSFWCGRDAFHGSLIGKFKQCHNTPCAKGSDESQPFSLICCPCFSTDSVCESTSKRNRSTSYEILGSGVILLKNYISLKDQVDIVNICQKHGAGTGGFYEPSHQSGAKLRLQMMCFGRNWDPVTKYKECYRSDGSKAPPLPYELMSFAKTSVQNAQKRMKGLPSMCPDICIVNFYSPVYGRLGLHQDRDESFDSLRRGLPVVSISIGDTAEFLYGYTRNKDKLDKVLLQSGDVLIFGGKSRHIFHGVTQVFPNTTPLPLLQQTALRPGRLNLTLRQF
ncbi:putative DNA oxidative demethylase [Helianthus annuus]|nr:putative DNA oxidative demethylase [Helianthus annuus]KAJ0895185.1 putative DNA oxidative demethylase [Helianthus annuus]